MKFDSDKAAKLAEDTRLAEKAYRDLDRSGVSVSLAVREAALALIEAARAAEADFWSRHD